MSIVMLSNPNQVDGGSVLAGAWSVIGGIFGATQPPLKALNNTKYAPDKNGNMNPISDLAYAGIPAIQPDDIVSYPVVPSGGYSGPALSPNAVENMFAESSKLSQEKIFQYFNNASLREDGYIDRLAGAVNNPPDLSNLGVGDMFSTTTKVLAAAIVAYLIIK